MEERRCVYILKGNRFYVGFTGDLERRLKEHRDEGTKITRELGDWNLVRVMECAIKTEAIKLERKIKRGGHIERWVENNI